MTTPPPAPLEITTVDATDDEQMRAWHRIATVAERQQIGEHSVVWTVPELMVNLREPRKDSTTALYVGTVAGEQVAAGMITLPQLDNLTAAELHVAVQPDRQRRGLGSLMLAHLERVAGERGRTRFDAMTSWPYDGPADGSGTSGVEFGRVHGYAVGLGDVQRELALPVPAEPIAALAAEAAPHHRDYRIRTWAGRVPDDLLPGWVELSSSLNTEAPTGDNELERSVPDTEAYRMGEAITEKQGRVRWAAAALDRHGDVVAYTDLVVPSPDQTWVFQWGTLVRRDHRGHRLGVAVKAANLLALLRSDVDLSGRRVVTWNAEVNDHMIGINERFGFVPGARCGELQKKV